jgi:hypothetical protein
MLMIQILKYFPRPFFGEAERQCFWRGHWPILSSVTLLPRNINHDGQLELFVFHF